MMEEDFADFSSFNDRVEDPPEEGIPTALVTSTTTSSLICKPRRQSLATIPVTVIQDKIKSAFPQEHESSTCQDEEVVPLRDLLSMNP